MNYFDFLEKGTLKVIDKDFKDIGREDQEKLLETLEKTLWGDENPSLKTFKSALTSWANSQNITEEAFNKALEKNGNSSKINNIEPLWNLMRLKLGLFVIGKRALKIYQYFGTKDKIESWKNLNQKTNSSDFERSKNDFEKIFSDALTKDKEEDKAFKRNWDALLSDLTRFSVKGTDAPLNIIQDHLTSFKGTELGRDKIQKKNTNLEAFDEWQKIVYEASDSFFKTILDKEKSLKDLFIPVGVKETPLGDAYKLEDLLMSVFQTAGYRNDYFNTAKDRFKNVNDLGMFTFVDSSKKQEELDTFKKVAFEGEKIENPEESQQTPKPSES